MDASPLGVCLRLTDAISRTRTVEEIYAIALEALRDGLGVSRASILLFDPDGVMRFKASWGLSDAYRAAVEGHTPWAPGTTDAEPIVVADVAEEPSLTPYLPVIRAEGIAAMAFIPLISLGRVIGKFMVYGDTPRRLTSNELQLASLIASHVAFSVERMRAEVQARRSEEHLRYALDAASMGTWDWDLTTNDVEWSPNLPHLHGLPAGTFDGTFASYEREIHPDDRPLVLASVQRALSTGVPHDVEYRIVAPDGTVRWVEGKGRVEYDEHGRPVRMSGVCMMVTRRKEAELARLAAAEEASRAKDEFLATLSHELRTPLNAILGWADMLQAGVLPPDRVRQAVDVIARNARLQAQLIEDILDLSRIITGKLEMTREPISMPRLLGAVTESLQPAADGKRIALTLTVSDAAPIVDGDAKRLHQVLGNVIANAIKFTPEGGRVDVRCGMEGDEVIVRVEDTGEGMPPEFAARVFERFRQADSRSTRRHGGLGLGLAIARHLVEQHGGRIHAHSDGLERGTTIEIGLPSAVATSAEPLSEPDHIDPSWRLDGWTALVVDDQADARDLIAMLLEQRGARVVSCDSAASALASMAGGEAHLIVADIAMPDVDGYALIRQLRQDGCRVPAIAVSAYARPIDRQHAREAGFDGYCPKPVDAASFERAVRAVMQAAG
jgi:PAS domain S-box-containing protein